MKLCNMMEYADANTGYDRGKKGKMNRKIDNL